MLNAEIDLLYINLNIQSRLSIKQCFINKVSKSDKYVFRMGTSFLSVSTVIVTKLLVDNTNAGSLQDGLTRLQSEAKIKTAK